jgi:hypothetical protein
MHLPRIPALALLLGVCCAAVAVQGCGSSGRAGFSGDNGGVDGGSLLGTDDGGTTGSLGGDGDGGVTSGGNEPPAEVWGHSPDTLYKVDPNTKAVTVTGKFKGCTNVIDVALDSASNMFVTTQDGLYKVDKTTASCTQIATGNYPNSLSFVPAGTLDPSVEALVGYQGDQYVRIDTQNGKITTLGLLGAGSGVLSSGDIVSVKGGPSYLTVTGGSKCGSMDCLIEVDPKTGKMTKDYGSIGHTAVFGLAFWAGTVYGFDEGGELFSVTIDASGKLTTAPIPVPGAPAGLKFWGAGSTTSAPPHGPA